MRAAASTSPGVTGRPWRRRAASSGVQPRMATRSSLGVMRHIVCPLTADDTRRIAIAVSHWTLVVMPPEVTAGLQHVGGDLGDRASPGERHGQVELGDDVGDDLLHAPLAGDG